MRHFFLASFLATLWCGCFCVVSVSSAQSSSLPTFRFGAVLPLSGAHASEGRVAEAALRASATTWRRAGINAELSVLDSSSDPFYAAAQTQVLIDRGVHALLCCESADVAAQVAPVVAAARVPTFSLTPVATETAPLTLFPLSVDDSAALTRLALGPPRAPLALLAPQGVSGALASRSLEDVSVGVVRYPAQRPRRTPLTPEALLVATLEPGSVVVWDNAEGTLQAAAALRARGYTGVQVVRAEVWRELGALGRAELTGAVSVVSPAVLGYRLPDAHPAKHSVSSFRRSLSGILFESSDVKTVTAAAAAWDAALLFGAAAEQVLTYADFTDTDFTSLTDPETAPNRVRGALREALVGLGPVAGVGGSYDFSDEAARGVLADSLVLAVWQGGRFLPLP